MTTKQEYEVIWVDATTLQLIHHQPKKAIFKDISHAIAFVKCVKPPAGTFVAICKAPVAATIGEKDNAKLTATIASTACKETEFKWEVVGRSPDDYTITHMIFDGAKLGFKERNDAQRCLDFINQFPNCVRRGLIIAIVPWKADRQWQPTLAMEMNATV